MTVTELPDVVDAVRPQVHAQRPQTARPRSLCRRRQAAAAQMLEEDYKEQLDDEGKRLLAVVRERQPSRLRRSCPGALDEAAETDAVTDVAPRSGLSEDCIVADLIECPPRCA
jgi:hypothetical protein